MEELVGLEISLELKDIEEMSKEMLEDVELGSKLIWTSDKDSCLNGNAEQLDYRHLLNCQFIYG